ncbi:hypothetical protein KP509_05G080100 [Ceratopteris richardii]|nr:hypothetical protein KP509_05G080100 [Ceratopteris richardii]
MEEEIKLCSPELPMVDSVIPSDSRTRDASTVLDADVLGNSDNNEKDSNNLQPSERDNNDSYRDGEASISTRQGNLTVEDVCCSLCNQLLYHPVVLNCGDVFCEPCLKGQSSKVSKCPSCQAPHSPGFVFVCLEFDKFLNSVFPSEYKNRQSQYPAASIDFTGSPSVEFMSEDLHISVGCDACGMFPMRGDRYRCKDCEEEVGFDLCGSCYSDSSSWIGRFNQKHQPTHRMEQIQSPLSQDDEISE